MDYMKTLATLSLGSRLKRLSEELFAEVATIYEEVNLPLNPNYFLLLNLINKMGPMGIVQIAEFISVSHPAISKLSNKMIKEGYLNKSPHPTDKRASQLSLTDKSRLILEQAKPVWKVLKKHLDHLNSSGQVSFLMAIDEFENNLQHLNLSKTVLQELKAPIKSIEVVNWDKSYKEDFKSLNMDWLNSQFNGELTSSDIQSLNHPEAYYLAQGGYLFFAKHEGNVVGCIALRPTKTGNMEISKMAVCSNMQGLGIGRLLLLNAINKIQTLQVQTVSLETNSKLLRAMTLYKHFGFNEEKHPNGKSQYSRADIYMELQLYV